MKEIKCKCPLGGDESNDCADCIYSLDFHFVDGECVEREENEYLRSDKHEEDYSRVLC